MRELSLLKRNMLANLAAQICSALLGVILVPVYLHYLGMEAYGLIGFFTSLQLLFTVLDLGFSITVNREVARRGRFQGEASQCRSLVFTLQMIYWGIGLAIGLALLILSGWLATHWLKAEHLNTQTIRQAIIILCITLSLRWSLPLYEGVLRGLEKQVLLNGISVSIALLRGLGVVFILRFISPTIKAFLLWQLLCAILEICFMTGASWRILPSTKGERTKFDIEEIRKVWKFAAILTACTVMAVILTQLDKILISKLLPLNQMGFYTVATILSSGIALAASPVFHTMFPRFSTLIAANHMEELASLYHTAAQFVAVLVCPMAGVLIVFSHDVLLLWTRSELVANQVSVTLSILVLGSLLNALMAYVPTALQMASGLMKIPFYTHFIACIIAVPSLYFGITHWGIQGGAINWFFLNLFFYLVVPSLMHHYILQTHKWRWYFQDSLLYLAVGLAFPVSFKWMLQWLPFSISPYFILGAVLIASYLIALFIFEPSRRFLTQKVFSKGGL